MNCCNQNSNTNHSPISCRNILVYCQDVEVTFNLTEFNAEFKYKRGIIFIICYCWGFNSRIVFNQWGQWIVYIWPMTVPRSDFSSIPDCISVSVTFAIPCLIWPDPWPSTNDAYQEVCQELFNQSNDWIAAFWPITGLESDPWSNSLCKYGWRIKC